jgi:hypothetical protein
MTSFNDSNKRNWLVQVNDLTDQQVNTVTQFVGTSSGVANPDLNIHHATVAMYLGYINNPKGPEEPQLVTKKLKVMLIFSLVFFLYF